MGFLNIWENINLLWILTTSKNSIDTLKNHSKTSHQSRLQDLVTDDALDLLSKMLVYDKNLRITAKEAL
jgi:serine/threonine protein kinase